MTNEQMKLEAILDCFAVSDVVIQQGDSAIAQYIDERFTIAGGTLSGTVMVRGARAIVNSNTHTVEELRVFAAAGFIQAQDLAGMANTALIIGL